MQEAVEDFFVYRLKSQLVCEGNYVSSSLGTLVCDCVEEDGLFIYFFFLFFFFYFFFFFFFFFFPL